MIKRIIEVSTPSYLHLKHQQLIIEQNKVEVASVPIEDIGALILEHSAIVISQPLIIACSQNKVAIIFCDDKHLPYSTILPIAEGNNLHQRILQQQINIRQPVKKRLWQQIIKQKIQNQANVLALFNKPSQPLQRLAKEVKSNDDGNREAIAAQYYWKALFGADFLRNQEGDGVNAILNYGYSIMRAMVARAICASGLHPALGLFHHNQYNALCLADDLMEPTRPWVDVIAYYLYQQNNNINITQGSKTPFLNLLSQPVQYQNKTVSLMVAIHYLMADLKRNYTQELNHLKYPVLNVKYLL